MIRHLRSLRLAVAAVVGTAALTACSSAPTRTYTLYAAPTLPAAVPTAYAGPPVRVDAVHVPAALDRIEIVSSVAPGELHLNDLDDWSAPLAPMVRQTLTADLAARLPAAAVIYPHLTKPDGALGISVDILEFGVDADGSHLSVSYAIGASPATATRATAQLHGTTRGTTAAATVQALSALLAQLADRITADLLTAGARAPP